MKLHKMSDHLDDYYSIFFKLNILLAGGKIRKTDLIPATHGFRIRLSNDIAAEDDSNRH